MRYSNQPARIIFNSYEPVQYFNRSWKPWQFAIIEVIAAAVIGFVILF